MSAFVVLNGNALLGSTASSPEGRSAQRCDISQAQSNHAGFVDANLILLEIQAHAVKKEYARTRDPPIQNDASFASHCA